ncbi:thioredoxin family protein [Sphingomicrobium sp. XHP0235]|uniref:protein-disulfide reductase DsbD family protein n=1 Tax=Sphingomicrobium aquimarinum TaxID=3133971 RepID=UPI0031FEE0EE
MLGRFFLTFLLLLAALPAQAQQNHIRPTLIAEQGVPVGGGDVELAIVFRADPGWHGYWLNPGDAGLPLQIEWDLPEGAEVGELRFPTPVEFEAAGLINYVYKGDHAILTRLSVPPRTSGQVRLAADLRWLACTDKVCVPEKGRVDIAIPVGEGTDRSLQFDALRRDLPRPLDADATFASAGETLSIALPIPETLEIGEPSLFLADDRIIDYAAEQRFRRDGDLLIVDLAMREGAEPSALSGVLRLGSGQGLEFDAVPGIVPTGGTPVTGQGGETTVWLALAGALLGGLLLNLMPCVFPVLTMKALHLARTGTSEARAKRDALGYTLGAVLGTAGLGLALILLREGGNAVGWAFQLQDPRTIFLLLILAGAITFNLLGLYELPVVAGDVETRSSVGTGALAAFVATPCAGPFLGTAIGTALVLPPAAGVGVFAMLGLGLALPFLALGFIPALRNRLPRPGHWMVTFKRWLALPMALTVAACLWLLWRLAGPVGLMGGIFALGIMAALLAFFARRVGMLKTALAGIGAIALLGVVVLPSRPIDRETSVPGTTVWSPERVAAARGAGRPVFVYFTADWCLTCKANESVAIARDSVQEAFGEADVAVLVADWTDGDDEITRFLEERGRAAVPLYLWYAPGEEAEELPQLLTPSMLTERAAAAS